jgi:hypothetical protein
MFDNDPPTLTLVLQSALSLTTNPNDSVWPEVVALLGWLILLRWVQWCVTWNVCQKQIFLTVVWLRGCISGFVWEVVV